MESVVGRAACVDDVVKKYVCVAELVFVQCLADRCRECILQRHGFSERYSTYDITRAYVVHSEQAVAAVLVAAYTDVVQPVTVLLALLAECSRREHSTAVSVGCCQVARLICGMFIVAVSWLLLASGCPTARSPPFVGGGHGGNLIAGSSE